jgi:SHS2 domain-containing protein
MKNMVKKPAYELMDHTADFGIHVFGDDEKSLFQNAAMAMMDQLVETAGLLPRKERQITIQGNDWPDLMVNWLREILYLCVGEELFVQSIQIESIAETGLTGHVWIDPFSTERHTLISEIKAVTYHGVQVFDAGSRWEAKVIFDM